MRMACYQIENEYGYDDARFKKDVDENFHCSICFNVLKEPRMCRNNEHIFCLACITRNLNENSETCPECSESLSVDTLRRAPRVVNNYLSELEIKCDFASRGCPEYIRVEALKVHVASCGFAPIRCPNEECGLEINKRDKVHHETQVCEYRKIKCHDCEHIQELMISLVEMNKKTSETLKENITQEFKKLESVNESLSKVNKDIAGLKGSVTQILKKLNKLDLTGVSTNPNELNTASSGPVLPGARSPVPRNVTRVKNVKKRSDMPATGNQRERVYEQPALPYQDVLNPTVLAQASAADQKQMLGERLFPLIRQTHPDSAGKITGMLLDIDNAELLHMLEFRDALAAKVEEVVSVLNADEKREQQRRPKQR